VDLGFGFFVVLEEDLQLTRFRAAAGAAAAAAREDVLRVCADFDDPLAGFREAIAGSFDTAFDSSFDFAAEPSEASRDLFAAFLERGFDLAPTNLGRQFERVQSSVEADFPGGPVGFELDPSEFGVDFELGPVSFQFGVQFVPFERDGAADLLETDFHLLDELLPAFGQFQFQFWQFDLEFVATAFGVRHEDLPADGDLQFEQVVFVADLFVHVLVPGGDGRRGQGVGFGLRDGPFFEQFDASLLQLSHLGVAFGTVFVVVLLLFRAGAGTGTGALFFDRLTEFAEDLQFGHRHGVDVFADEFGDISALLGAFSDGVDSVLVVFDPRFHVVLDGVLGIGQCETSDEKR